MAQLELFGAVRKCFDAMGFYVPSRAGKICQFNRRNTGYFLAIVAVCIPVAGFLFFKANSAYEYADSFFVLITGICMLVYFTEFFCKMRSFYDLIENYQELIGKREFFSFENCAKSSLIIHNLPPVSTKERIININQLQLPSTQS